MIRVIFHGKFYKISQNFYRPFDICMPLLFTSKVTSSLYKSLQTSDASSSMVLSNLRPVSYINRTCTICFTLEINANRSFASWANCFNFTAGQQWDKRWVLSSPSKKWKNHCCVFQWGCPGAQVQVRVLSWHPSSGKGPGTAWISWLCPR